MLDRLVWCAVLGACGDNQAVEPDAMPDAGVEPDATACTFPARQPDPSPYVEALLATLEQRMAIDNVAGMAFSINTWEGSLTHALGRRQARSCEPFTPKTRIRLGRPTRTLVSMAILIAEAEGKLALTDPVGMRVPGFHVTNGDADAVTIQTLLEHSAGLYVAAFMNACPSHDLVGYWSTVDAQLEFTPGTAVASFDEELSLLGAVIANVYGKPYRDVIREKIFVPLGMTATFDHDEFLLGEHALGGPMLVDPPPCGTWEPVRQVYASLDDLMNLGNYLAGTPNSLIPISDLRRAQIRDAGKPHHASELSTGYGMETMVYDVSGEKLSFTDGDIGISGAAIDLLSGYTIAFVENNGGCTYCYTDEIIAAFTPFRPYDSLEPLPTTRWNEYAGTWVDNISSPARTLAIEFTPPATVIASFNGLATPLTKFGEDSFDINIFGTKDRLRFWRDGNDVPQLLTTELGNLGAAFHRVVP